MLSQQFELPFTSPGPPDPPPPDPCGLERGRSASAVAGVSPFPPADLSALELVRHPRARRYVLRVRADGRVRVTMPRWGSRREAVAFAGEQRGWIDKQRAKLAIHPPPSHDNLPPHLIAPLRQRARVELPARLRELAAQQSLVIAHVSVKNQRWRWGSCSPGRRISLNWRLVLMPDWVRDYVLIHELMHLRRMDHSPKFWALVAKACPEYQAARRWLRAWCPS